MLLLFTGHTARWTGKTFLFDVCSLQLEFFTSNMVTVLSNVRTNRSPEESGQGEIPGPCLRFGVHQKGLV